ncbi:polysaccharide deacetylase family protein [Pseudohoeflea coraliihabitans]|uniref:Chitooligosaccharide deacetylase n=1 Tax=Pseudohoeflea coraliihabitans TaxID=2860393 RepID=A0ABS6WNF3_9HYPH|nr:polysaccharide deacetylase family protein [Pseudohoeflea sp. DP4N28-3]MBW3096942.1 polysaccharide deacetylase family protein [Pseudohoeflea sp. DP4N28-3]
MLHGPHAIAARRWLKHAAISGGLDVLGVAARSGLGGRLSGRGAIFTLHHVRPAEDSDFAPAAHLEITPEFLDAAICSLKAMGHQPVSLLDLPAHLARGPEAGPAMVFTLDDGYRDNLQHALPVFERHGIPFTVFVTGGFIDRTHSIWWKTAAALISRVERFDFAFDGTEDSVSTRTLREKYAAYDRLHRTLGAHDQARFIEDLDRRARKAGIEPLDIVDREVMTDADLRCLLQSPLATLGAHTISHCSLAHIDAQALEAEIGESAERVAAITGRCPRAFAYPYGDHRAAGAREFEAARAFGFDLAVTTNADVLRGSALKRLHALPRISLNGYYQKARHVAALASGLPFAARRLSA